MTGSIINSTHGKLSIWVTANRTAHIRLYQKSARKLVTIKHFSRKTQATSKKVAFIIYMKHFKQHHGKYTEKDKEKSKACTD